MALNAPGHWKYFLSYVQSESGGEATKLAYELGPETCWFDDNMSDKSEAAMNEGVLNSDYFVVILSPGYFKSMWCRSELMWALEAEKRILSCFKMQCNVGAILSEAPEDLGAIKGIDSIPLSRDKDFFSLCLQKLKARAACMASLESGVRQIEMGLGNFGVSGASIFGTWYGQCPGNCTLGGARKAFGVASYHFDNPECCYISWQNAPEHWLWDNGVPFKGFRASFDKPTWNSTTRTFTGIVTLPCLVDGCRFWDYVMVFSKDLKTIESGTVHERAEGVPFGGPSLLKSRYPVNLVYHVANPNP